MLRFNDFGYYVGIGGLSAPAIAPLRRLRSGSVLTVRMAVPMVQVGVVRVPVHDGACRCRWVCGSPGGSSAGVRVPVVAQRAHEQREAHAVSQEQTGCPDAPFGW